MKQKKINIKNRTYYFYIHQIDLKDSNARLLKIDKKDYNEIDIYYIGYVTIKKIGDYNNINSVNPLYLMINEMIGHIEKKGDNKYLVLEVLEKKLKLLMVEKKLNMAKILKKLDLSLMMIATK